MPRSMPTAFFQYDPTRLPSWRWCRALSLLDCKRKRSMRIDDAPTARALAFLRQQAKKLPQHDDSATSPYADIHAALQLCDSGRDRHVVEARVLAGQTTAEIAARTGTPREVIETYESLFFDCRDRLHCRDWIYAKAVRLFCLGGVDDHAGVVLKGFAFGGGAVILDAGMPYVLGDCDLFEALPNLKTPEGRTEMKVRLTVAVEMLPLNERTRRLTDRISLVLLQTRSKESGRRPPQPVDNEKLGERLLEMPNHELTEASVAAEIEALGVVADLLRQAG